MENSKYDHLRFQDLVIYYNNKESAQQTLEEVFGNGHYQFDTASTSPLIIDAGSNIGIATLFFKKCYPAARVICFEPDPYAFEVLQLNVKANHLSDITLINAALSAKEGLINFYGQIHPDNPDARGNSIIDVWGVQRVTHNEVKVKSVKLSSYMDSEIDFLKLDIEGAEEQVLEELGNKLNYVKAMSIEFHETELIQHINNLERVKLLLQKYHFDYEIIVNDISVLPDVVHDWAKRVNPHLYVIRANQSL